MEIHTEKMVAGNNNSTLNCKSTIMSQYNANNHGCLHPGVRFPYFCHFIDQETETHRD